MVDTIDFGTFKWHHITNPTVEDLDFLRDNFHFHPLDIDDCSSFVQRPKIDIYDDYFFLVFHFPILDKRTQPTIPIKRTTNNIQYNTSLPRILSLRK